MPTIKYVGPHPAVDVEVAPRKWVSVDHGATVEVGNDLAASLLQQVDNWQGTTKKGSKTAAVTGDNKNAD
jgi:hypothetical protein